MTPWINSFSWYRWMHCNDKEFANFIFLLEIFLLLSSVSAIHVVKRNLSLKFGPSFYLCILLEKHPPLDFDHFIARAVSRTCHISHCPPFLSYALKFRLGKNVSDEFHIQLYNSKSTNSLFLVNALFSKQLILPISCFKRMAFEECNWKPMH